MIKEEKGIEAIEYADSLFNSILKKYNDYSRKKNEMSEKDSKLENNVIATQLGLICEIYLKGLLLPHLKVSIPEELKSKVSALSEEEEYMFLISNDQQIEQWNKRRNLNKKELKMLQQSSIKYFGHSLFSLIGSKFESTDQAKKPNIYLDKNVRESIILGMKEFFISKDDIDSFEKYLKTYQKMAESLDDMPYGKTKYDELIEKQIEDPTVGDAFIRSRYATFDEYVADTDFLVRFAMAIRNAIEYEFNTVIDIKEKSESNEQQIGRLIFPDSGSHIYIDDNDDGIIDRIYELEPKLRDNLSDPTMSVKENPVIKSGQDIFSIKLDNLIKRIQDNPEVFGIKSNSIIENLMKNRNGNTIYYKPDSKVRIKYTRNGKEVQLILNDGKLIEDSLKDNGRD